MTIVRWITGMGALALMVTAPAVGRAQVVIGADPVAGPPNMTPAPIEEKIVGGTLISADSLKALKAFVAAKTPMVTIDGKMSTPKAFAALKQVSTVTLTMPSEGDLRYYGDKAKNGILSVTSKPGPKKKIRIMTLPNGTVLVDSGNTAGAGSAAPSAAAVPAN